MILNFRNCSRPFVLIRGWFFLALSSVILAGSVLAAPATKNVVLVHGAFVDG